MGRRSAPGGQSVENIVDDVFNGMIQGSFVLWPARRKNQVAVAGVAASSSSRLHPGRTATACADFAPHCL